MGLRNRLSQLGPALSFTALATVLLACGSTVPGNPGGQQPTRPGEPLYPYDANAVTVVGAENLYGDLLHQVGGSRLRIYSFLSDPSADPHQYESNAANARAVADSRLVIENGLGYDSFMDKLLRASPRSDRAVINVQRLVGARDGDNPHLWYDPTVMPRVAASAADALARIDPDSAPVYTSGLGRFAASLEPLAGAVATMRQRFAGAPVAFTEPVFGPMSDAIGLRVRSPADFMKAVEEGNDPPSRAVAEERDLITRHQVRVLIYNSQTVTRVTTQMKELALENGVPVVGVSETLPAGKTFQEWQLAQLQDLEAALSRP